MMTSYQDHIFINKFHVFIVQWGGGEQCLLSSPCGALGCRLVLISILNIVSGGIHVCPFFFSIALHISGEYYVHCLINVYLSSHQDGKIIAYYNINILSLSISISRYKLQYYPTNTIVKYKLKRLSL